MMLFTFLLSAVALIEGLAASPQEIARELQKKYETVRDFKADFVHTYEGGVLRKKVVERGSLLIKKPGKMRWTYESPERKLFVSDGTKIYSYIQDDKQVIVGTVPGEDEATTPALFLTGKGNLERDFIASTPEGLGVPPGSLAVKFSPKKPEQDYDWLTLVVDARTLQIQRLIAVDRQGGRSTFEFKNLKENVGLSDKDFVFRIPPGAHVVTESKATR